jgi:uncharacterized protein with HEPN domain
MIKYSDEIAGTIKRFSLDYDTFKEDYVAINAISMCVLQIGELAGNLTDKLKATYNKLPWRDIVAVRNRAAHAYESIKIEYLWSIASESIPELKAYCETILKEETRQ